MNAKVRAVTWFLNAMTALVRAKYGDIGAIANAAQAVKILQSADQDFLDPDFEDACNELAGAASLRVIIAGHIPGDEASRVKKKEQPSSPIGASVTQAGSGHPSEVSRTHPGDVSAKNSGLV